MTFDEFFKKKKIDLVQLQSAEPALYLEFKNHYEQMGEKSFDHTKKYWFNQLRRRFIPTPEIKAEKVIIENPIAEQTIAESLTEPAAPATTGFKPRFKAAATPPKPAEEKPEAELPEEKPSAGNSTAPATGFKPQFKAAIVSKPVEEKPAEAQPAPEDAPAEPEAPNPAVGFKPRFKASMAAKPVEEKPAEDQPTAEEKTAEPEASKPVEERSAEPEAPNPAVGFKPRFKASMVAKPAEEKIAEEKPVAEIPVTEETPAEPEAPKPAVGFKPRFKASILAKPMEEKAADEQPAEYKPEEPEIKKEVAVAEKPAEETAPAKTIGFKPRFNAAKMAKPKSGEKE